jgi:hypothetical protein
MANSYGSVAFGSPSSQELPENDVEVRERSNVRPFWDDSKAIHLPFRPLQILSDTERNLKMGRAHPDPIALI